MALIPDRLEIRPTQYAALLVLVRRWLNALDVDMPQTVAEIVDMAGCGTSQTYVWVDRLEEAIEALDEQTDRETETSPQLHEARFEVACRVRDFLQQHPGAVEEGDQRARYADLFRRFVLTLRRPGASGAELTVEQFAEATGVPLGTTKDWLKAARLEEPDDEAEPATDLETADPEVATILAEYDRWEGSFSGFCRHLRAHQHIEASRTHIAHILEAAGSRSRHRRPDGRETRTVGFTELFCGAQWTGDGSPMVVELDGQTFGFNLEAIVDVASNAVVAAQATPVENQQALIEAFEQAKTTCEDQPIGLTLDNRPSNHTARVEQAVDPTEVVATTPGRPTAKASCEGMFGLFEQMLPPIEVDGTDRRQKASQILELVACAFARGRNGRPRSKLDGQTPAKSYRDADPTDQQVEEAKAYIAQLRRRQTQIRETRKRRAEPQRRSLLEEAFGRLEIPDPDGRLADSLAGFTREAIVGGIAIFEGKQQTGTVPDGADPGPYLSGIIKNEHNRLEQEAIAEALLKVRLRQRDLAIGDLEAQRDGILSEVDPAARLERLVDRALEAEPRLDFRFFKSAAVDELATHSIEAAESLYKHLSRRIGATYTADKTRRQQLLVDLSGALPTIP